MTHCTIMSYLSLSRVLRVHVCLNVPTSTLSGLVHEQYLLPWLSTSFKFWEIGIQSIPNHILTSSEFRVSPWSVDYYRIIEISPIGTWMILEDLFMPQPLLSQPPFKFLSISIVCPCHSVNSYIQLIIQVWPGDHLVSRNLNWLEVNFKCDPIWWHVWRLFSFECFVVAYQ